MIAATLTVSVVNYDDRFSRKSLCAHWRQSSTFSHAPSSRTRRNNRLRSCVPCTAAVVMATPWAGWARAVQLGFRRGEEHNERNVLPPDPCWAHGCTLAHIFASRRNSRYAIQITRGSACEARCIKMTWKSTFGVD